MRGLAIHDENKISILLADSSHQVYIGVYDLIYLKGNYSKIFASPLENKPYLGKFISKSQFYMAVNGKGYFGRTASSNNDIGMILSSDQSETCYTLSKEFPSLS